MFSNTSGTSPTYNSEEEYCMYMESSESYPIKSIENRAYASKLKWREPVDRLYPLDMDRLLSTSAFSSAHRYDEIYPQHRAIYNDSRCPLYRPCLPEGITQEKDNYYPFMLFPQESRSDRRHGYGLFHQSPMLAEENTIIQRPPQHTWSDIVQLTGSTMRHPLSASKKDKENAAAAEESTMSTKKPSHSVKLLAESISFLSLGTRDLAGQTKYPVLKISNIPWSISMTEIQDILFDTRMPDTTIAGQNIHIMMNKTTGKTLADAYVEVMSSNEVERTIKNQRRTLVKGRKLFITPSSQSDLMRGLFPEWTGQFHEGRAEMPRTDTGLVPAPLIQRKEFESLLAICRNYKLHFSRKCGERPFEHFISLLVKFPWDQPHIMTTLQRDHLYEYYKLATGILKTHSSKAHSSLEPTLLTRMIRAALLSPGLTVPQKKGILTASCMDCPSDLSQYLEKPPETDEVSLLSESLLEQL